MRTIRTYKGIENPPVLFGLNVNYLIAFFLAFLFHLLLMGFVTTFLGYQLFILEPLLLYLYYRWYNYLKRSTKRQMKKLEPKKSIHKTKNTYSIDILKNEPFNRNRG